MGGLTDLFGGSRQTSTNTGQNFGENFGQNFNLGLNTGQTGSTSFGNTGSTSFGEQGSQSTSRQGSQQAGFNQGLSGNFGANFGQTVDVTPEAFAALRPYFSQAFQSALGGGPQYGGPLTVGLGGQEQAFLNAIGQGAGPNPFAQAAQGRLGDIILGQNNPFLERAIESATRPIYRNLEETLATALPNRFTLAGQDISPGGSTAFNAEAARAIEGAVGQAGDISTQITNAAYENERNRQLQAALQQPQFEAQRLQSLVTGLQASALPRLIQDQGVERGLQLFRDRVNTILSALGQAGIASQFGQQTGGITGGFGTTFGQNLGTSFGTSDASSFGRTGSESFGRQGATSFGNQLGLNLGAGQTYGYTGGLTEGQSEGSTSPGILNFPIPF